MRRQATGFAITVALPSSFAFGRLVTDEATPFAVLRAAPCFHYE